MPTVYSYKGMFGQTIPLGVFLKISYLPELQNTGLDYYTVLSTQVCTGRNVMPCITVAQWVVSYERMECSFLPDGYCGHLTTADASASITVSAREATECWEAHVNSSRWYIAVGGSAEAGLHLSPNRSNSTCRYEIGLYNMHFTIKQLSVTAIS